MPIHEYRILEKMAVGSFGMVFRIQRILDDAILVMKRIPLEDLDAEQRHEAAQEMRLMTELHHPYIVTQRDAFLFNENDLCLIMDYYDGGDLEPLVIAQRDKDEYFSLQQVMLWFVQMLLATDYLHVHDIVHRDLKTRNLFVDSRTNSIAVGDFGIAEKIDTSKIATWRNLNNTRSQRLSNTQLDGVPHSPCAPPARRWSSGSAPLASSPHGLPRSHFFTAESDADVLLSRSTLHRTPEGSPVRHDRLVVSSQSPLNPFYLQSPEQLNQAMRGTPLYMAPEALQGGHVGPKADVWSMGCILYELLALRHPFETRDIGGLVMRVTQGMREPLPAHYPAAVHGLVDAMLAVDPRARPSCQTILQLPLVKAYVELLQILRVPSAGPQDATEVALAKQLHVLGQMLQPSAKHILSSEDAPVLAYTSIERALDPPLNPPSVEHRLARQRQAEAAAGAGTMYASASAESSVSSSAFPMGAGTFFTAGAPLLATPSPEKANTSASRLSTDPSLGGGPGMSGPMIMAPTASMRPFMIYDNTPTSESRPSNGIGSRLSSNMAGLSVSEAAAAAAAAVSCRSPLLPPPQPRARTRSKDNWLSEDIDRFYAEYANVVDMRDKVTDVIALEVEALRDAVQQLLRQRKQRDDGAILQQRFGSQVTGSMPGTTATTVSSAGSPCGTRVVGGTRVYYNDLYSCLVRQQSVSQRATWAPRGVVPAAQFHDSMPVSSSSPSITPSPVPATSDGVHGRQHSGRDAPLSARTGRLGAAASARNPTVPRGDRPGSGALRRALFDAEGSSLPTGDDSVRSDKPQDTPLPQRLPNILAGPPVMADTGAIAGTTPMHELSVAPAYLARREQLVRRVSAVLSNTVWQAVYWYYRETSLLQRDPRTVLGWVPDRRQWRALPFVEELVVLDRFLVGGKAA